MENSERNTAEKVFELLGMIGAEYTLLEHRPLFTMSDAAEVGFDGIQPKNLFLKDKKSGKYYLVVISGYKRLDMKKFRNITGAGSKTTFVDEEELMDIMGITRGACSPFGIINDKNKKVILVIDEDVCGEADTVLNIHPNINSMTVKIEIEEFKKYIEHMILNGHEIIIGNL